MAVPPSGQAVLYTAIRRSDGLPVVIKVFNRDHEELPRVWSLWANADHPNIVPLLYSARYPPRAYEMTPLAAHGALDRRMHGSGGGPGALLSLGEAEQVLRQIGSALDYIHNSPPNPPDVEQVRTWVHLDVKPSNILITSLEPFTVQLADFGIARVQENTREQTLSALSPANAAPEMFRRVRSPAADWWALGMTLIHAMSGRHPFFDEEAGQYLTEESINDVINSGPVQFDEELFPERWVHLLRGLLTWSPDTRWTNAQVSEWLAGADPDVDGMIGLRPQQPSPAPVSVSVPPAPTTDAVLTGDAPGLPGAPTTPSPATGSTTGPVPGPGDAPLSGPDTAAGAEDLVGAPFLFAGQQITRPRELAALMAGYRQEAGESMTGVSWARLRAWSATVSAGLATALEEVDSLYVIPRRPVDRTVCEVIARLDATARPVFQGRPADLADLVAAVGLATAPDRGPEADRQRTEARQWIDSLYTTESLRALARHDGCADLATADEDWHRWFAAAETGIASRETPFPTLASLPGGGSAMLRPMLLRAALDPGYADQLQVLAERALTRRNRGVAWFTRFRTAAVPPNGAPFHALMILTGPYAEDAPRGRAGRRAAAGAVPVGGIGGIGGIGGAGAGVPGTDGDLPAQLALRLRAHVDEILNNGAAGADWLPPADAPAGPGAQRFDPPRPGFEFPDDRSEPLRAGPMILVGGVLLALLAAVGTALQTSPGEGALVGAFLLAVFGVLAVLSARRRMRVAEGLVGAITGALIGAPITALLGGAVGLAAGKGLGWPVFWAVWVLAVAVGAILGSAEAADRRPDREALPW